MLSKKTLMMATIILSQATSQAVNISAGASGGLTFIQLTTDSLITPHSGAEDVATSFGLRVQNKPVTAFESISGFVHAQHKYDKLIGFYGTLAGHTFTTSSSVFLNGSLNIKPEKFIPSLSLGAYYETQSGSVVELGAAVSRMAFDLESMSTGALFNDFESKLETGLSAFTGGLEFKVSIPFNDMIQGYAATQYGIDLGKASLKHRKIEGDQPASLLANNDVQFDLGNIYSLSPKVSLSSISIGARIAVSEIE